MIQKANIIDGAYHAKLITDGIKVQVAKLKEQHQVSLTLAIIIVGNNPVSLLYVRNKCLVAEQVGISTKVIHLMSDITLDELKKVIQGLNKDPLISGIIVQLPLPKHLDKSTVLEMLDPDKDVDGFHPLNVGYLHGGKDLGDFFVPCTALGCLHLIKSCTAELSGKRAVVIGRSNIVGRPTAALLLRENCTVTICHNSTQNLAEITKQADIVVCAIGQPKLLTAEYLNTKAIVIDVGISNIADSSKVVGDVDFANVIKKVSHITPVPKGVGPMTIAFLLSNTVKTAILKLS